MSPPTWRSAPSSASPIWRRTAREPPGRPCAREWREVLADDGVDRALVVVAHPDDADFLGLAEGTIAQGSELRRQIVWVIRQVRPRRLLTWSPEWNWSRFRTSCHIDHRATGELALTAAYPDAGNAFVHPPLVDDEALELWAVEEIWLLNAPEPNHFVDVTDTFDQKIEALRAHRSQTGHRRSTGRPSRRGVPRRTQQVGPGIAAHKATAGARYRGRRD